MNPEAIQRNQETIQRKSLKKLLKAKLNKACKTELASKIGMGFSPSFWDKTS